MATDDALDIRLRSASEIAARSVILATLLRRLWLESPVTDLNDGEREAEAFDLRTWLQTEGLSGSLMPEERLWLDRPIGAPSEDALPLAPLVAEGLAALGWSLQLTPLPSPGDLTGTGVLMNIVPAPWTPAPPWIARAALRSENEIARERERAELLAWRISVESLRRHGSDQEKSEYGRIIADTVREATLVGMADDIRGRDFLFAGTAITAVVSGELDQFLDLATQRLRAFNWVCGFGATWDRVPLDV